MQKPRWRPSRLVMPVRSRSPAPGQNLFLLSDYSPETTAVPKCPRCSFSWRFTRGVVTRVSELSRSRSSSPGACNATVGRGHRRPGISLLLRLGYRPWPTEGQSGPSPVHWRVAEGGCPAKSAEFFHGGFCCHRHQCLLQLLSCQMLSTFAAASRSAILSDSGPIG